ADRWYSGAGIYRKVYLRILPQDHLDPENIKVYTELDGTMGKLTVDAGIRKPVSMHLQKDDRKDHADSLD
ncbi:MAG: hypothetical protein RR466_11430, partial [Hungatella sp.]